jgi:hypothetical protein
VDRRDAYNVTGLDPVICLDAAFVNPDLTLAHGPVDPGFGDALEFSLEKIVQPLASIFLAYFHKPYLTHKFFIIEGLIFC